MAAGQNSLQHIGRKIQVKCIDNITRVGFLYTVDPLTNALVIVNHIVLCNRVGMDVKETKSFENSKSTKRFLGNDNRNVCENTECKHWHIRCEIIMGDAYTVIEDIHEGADSDEWSSIEKSVMQRLELCKAMVNTQLDPEELKSKMDSVVEFLKSHHLPLTVDNDLIVLFDGLVKIGPPYTISACASRNSVVLDKVHKLLEQFSCVETKQINQNE